MHNLTLLFAALPPWDRFRLIPIFYSQHFYTIFHPFPLFHFFYSLFY